MEYGGMDGQGRGLKGLFDNWGEQKNTGYQAKYSARRDNTCHGRDKYRADQKAQEDTNIRQSELLEGRDERTPEPSKSSREIVPIGQPKNHDRCRGGIV